MNIAIIILSILALFFTTPLFAFIIGHHNKAAYRLLEGEIIMDQNNSFDHRYLIYSKGNRPLVFPYNNRAVCILKNGGGENVAGKIQIQFESAYTFHSSAPRFLEQKTDSSSTFHACFEHDRHSFLIYQNGRNNNETHIIRSGNEKVFNFSTGYTRFLFDHVQSLLYIQFDDQWLYRLNLDAIISKFWSPSTQWGRKNARLLLEPITRLPENQDVMIVNGMLYWILGDTIYKRHLQLEQERRIFVSKIGAEKFGFIPFPLSSIADNPPPILLSTASISDDNDNNNNNLHNCIAIYLAIIKACIIALLLWWYRKPMVESIRKKFKKPSSTNNSDEGQQFELSGGIYPTAPLFLSVDTKKM
jgi:hypothetical protein